MKKYKFVNQLYDFLLAIYFCNIKNNFKWYKKEKNIHD